MNSIVYTVTVVDDQDPDRAYGSHTPAIFTDFIDAVAAVRENEAELSEGGINQYVVIEKTFLNRLYPEATERMWFRWSAEAEEYEQIETPPHYTRVGGFGIG